MAINSDDLSILEGAGGEVAGVIAISKAAALAYLFFNLFSPPCVAAMGAMNSEMKSTKWLLGGIGLQFGVGYTVAFIVYQIGTLIKTGSFGVAFLPGLIAILSMAVIVCALIAKTEYELKKRG